MSNPYVTLNFSIRGSALPPATINIERVLYGPNNIDEYSVEYDVNGHTMHTEIAHNFYDGPLLLMSKAIKAADELTADYQKTLKRLAESTPMSPAAIASLRGES